MSLLKKNSFILIVLFLACLPLLFPLFRQGFFVTDDGDWMIIRMSAFYEVLRDGQFPVRFLSRLHHGYGYPVANFLYPGFMYIGVPIHILGFSFVDTVKVLLGASLFSSLLFCYFWLRRFFAPPVALLSALIYGYAPYHLYDFYIRGSVGEMLALAIAPFIFWQIERQSTLWISIGIGLLILSHNTLTLLFVPVILAYMLLDVFVRHKKRVRASLYVVSLVAGIGLAAFFWMPALFDLQYTVFTQTSVSNWGEYFASIDLIGWQTVLIVGGVLLLFIFKKIHLVKHRLTVLFLFVAFSTIFFSTVPSSFLWEILPVSTIQFPFRFLSVTIVAIAFLTGVLLTYTSSKQRFLLSVALVIASATTAWNFISSISYTNQPDTYYSTNLATTTVQNEYMPKWVKSVPSALPTEKVSIENAEVTNLSVSPNTISFSASSENSTNIMINTIYFPGWSAFVDGEASPIEYEIDGLINVAVPSGKHDVQLVFSETPLRLFADGVSVLSFVLLLGFVFLQNKKRFA